MNTSSTRVELIWSVSTSPSITDAQRERLEAKLANRINAEGELVLAESGSRSQNRNREVVTARFAALLREALVVPRTRRKTRPTAASVERRIEAKKRRSEIKKLRGPPPPD